MSKWTAEQVAAIAAECMHDEGASMLRAYAALLRERESAEPVAWRSNIKWDDGPGWSYEDNPAFAEKYPSHYEPLFVHPPQPQEKGATHCDNCGLTWLDDGLNPVGCPYCKDRSAKTSVPKGSLQELLTTQIDGIQPDFRIAVQGDGKGVFTHIIIHPFDHDGDTLDFWVRGDRLYRSNDPAWEDLAESGGLLEAQPRPPAPAADCDARDTRTCTCHPDDNPPKPCARKYAYSECSEVPLKIARGMEIAERAMFFALETRDDLKIGELRQAVIALFGPEVDAAMQERFAANAPFNPRNKPPADCEAG